MAFAIAGLSLTLWGCPSSDSSTAPDSSDSPVPLSQTLFSKAALVCDGAGDPEAAPWTPDTRPNKIVEPYATFPDPAWAPSSLGEWELAACLESATVATSTTCQYGTFGKTAAYSLLLMHKISTITVRAAQTGQVIGTVAIAGNYTCPGSILYTGQTTVTDYADTSMANQANLLRKFVE